MNQDPRYTDLMQEIKERVYSLPFSGTRGINRSGIRGWEVGLYSKSDNFSMSASGRRLQTFATSGHRVKLALVETGGDSILTRLEAILAYL